MAETTSKTTHTPGPWKWQEARHTGDSKAEPRTLVSLSADQYSKDGRNLGHQHVLVQGVRMSAALAAAVRDLQLEIHAKPGDEALIAAAPDLLAVVEAVADEWRKKPSEQNWTRVANLATDALVKATPPRPEVRDGES